MRDAVVDPAPPAAWPPPGLRELRAEAAALMQEVFQLDLLAKRAEVAGEDGAELAALHVADVRARVAEARRVVALHGAALDALARKGAPR